MKKLAGYLVLLLLTQTGLAQHIMLDNATMYPMKGKNSKIAIQWVANAQEMQRENKAIIHGLTLNAKSLNVLNQSGKIRINIPENSQYFRILVWSTGKREPDLISNWVSVVPDKNYSIAQDKLIPAALISGAGC